MIPTNLKWTRILLETMLYSEVCHFQRLSRILDARQMALKLIANVTYGYAAANFSGRMPCVEVADAIVSKVIWLKVFLYKRPICLFASTQIIRFSWCWLVKNTVCGRVPCFIFINVLALLMMHWFLQQYLDHWTHISKSVFFLAASLYCF